MNAKDLYIGQSVTVERIDGTLSQAMVLDIDITLDRATIVCYNDNKTINVSCEKLSTWPK